MNILTETINTNQSLKKGCLIVFEGIDGTGKSTQIKLLADALIHEGFDVVTTREPTNSHYGKKIRELYSERDSVSREEELELFLLDRQEHVDHFITPHLQKKRIILCDRYYLSTIAYQGALGMDILEIKEKNSFAPDPDIAFILEIDPLTSIERITQNRGDELNDFEQEESLRRVDAIFSSLNYTFIRRIDANGADRYGT